jgi:hypothetical protein
VLMWFYKQNAPGLNLLVTNLPEIYIYIYIYIYILDFGTLDDGNIFIHSFKLTVVKLLAATLMSD